MIDEKVQAPNVPGRENRPKKSGKREERGQDNQNEQEEESQEEQAPERQPEVAPKSTDKTLLKVADKVREAENVLIALSSDPSVDEMAAALALAMSLDTLGKHATAIYSGKTPNVLEFLNPEETFETNADSLQDFIIALNKSKADHLRYKIDGDYVKVYITPYRTTIDEDDLEFSRGDFNVDLVMALNVATAGDLDAALKEYGRIVHDAKAVNITNKAAGEFGDVEWVNEKASAVSEMVAELVIELSEKISAGVATACLTGIVAATDKFANEATTPKAMTLAGELMRAGADQQEVFKNMSMDLEYKEREEETEDDSEVLNDGTELAIKHQDSEKEEKKEEKPEEDNAAIVNSILSKEEEKPAEEAAETPAEIEEKKEEVPTIMGAGPMVGLEQPAGGGAVEGGSLADQIVSNLNSGAGTVADVELPAGAPMPSPAMTENTPMGAETPQIVTGAGAGLAGPMGAEAPAVGQAPEGSVGSMTPAVAPLNEGPTADYSAMIDQALAEPAPQGVMNPAMAATPEVAGMAPAADVPNMSFEPANGAMPEPGVMGMPEASAGGVLPMPGQELAPPPMTPTPDFGAMPPTPEQVMAPAMQPQQPVPQMPQVMDSQQPQVVQPMQPAQPVAPQQDPSAFQIPGM